MFRTPLIRYIDVRDRVYVRGRGLVLITDIPPPRKLPKSGTLVRVLQDGAIYIVRGCEYMMALTSPPKRKTEVGILVSDYGPLTDEYWEQT